MARGAVWNRRQDDRFGQGRRSAAALAHSGIAGAGGRRGGRFGKPKRGGIREHDSAGRHERRAADARVRTDGRFEGGGAAHRGGNKRRGDGTEASLGARGELNFPQETVAEYSSGAKQ